MCNTLLLKGIQTKADARSIGPHQMIFFICLGVFREKYNRLKLIR